MSISSSYATVPFSGNIDLITQFYKLLGVKVEKGILKFDNFEIFFGEDILKADNFEIGFAVEKDLSQIESQITENGGTLLESGFDISGPFIIAKDPAGLRIRITMSLSSLKKVVQRGKV